MKNKKQKFPLIRFRWIFLVDSIIVIGAMLSFGGVAFWALDLQPENAVVILYMIPPMIISLGICTLVILKSIRKKMDVLLNGIKAVAAGDLDVSLNTNGAHEYKAIYEDFNKMVRELKATKKEMQDFTNEFSHEFKTPITSIYGFAKFLADTGKNIESPDRMKYLRAIESEAMRLSELSQNTLLLSKVEAYQIISDKENYNLCEQIKLCTILFLPKIEEKNIELELDLPDCIRYCGNAELLEQVWINLLSNAVKFTPENGEITVTAEVSENKIIIAVSDTGPGMDKETMAHIFEKYYQGAASRKGGGNGIGLSIVHRIITLSGGEITVSSTPGVGSRFQVVL